MDPWLLTQKLARGARTRAESGLASSLTSAAPVECDSLPAAARKHRQFMSKPSLMPRVSVALLAMSRFWSAIDRDCQERRLANQVHLTRTTLYKYLAAESFPERAPRSASLGAGRLLAPYRAYLRKRCEQGCQNAQQLYRAIHAASDLSATHERYSGGCKRKDCFLVAMNFAKLSITGTTQ